MNSEVVWCEDVGLAQRKRQAQTRTLPPLPPEQRRDEMRQTMNASWVRLVDSTTSCACPRGFNLSGLSCRIGAVEFTVAGGSA